MAALDSVNYSVSLWIPTDYSDLASSLLPNGKLRVETTANTKRFDLFEVFVDGDPKRLLINLRSEKEPYFPGSVARVQDIIRLSRLTLCDKTASGVIACRFFEPTSKAVDPEGAPRSANVKTSKAARTSAQPEKPKDLPVRWRIKLPVLMPVNGPKLYIDSVTVRIADRDYAMTPSRKLYIDFSKLRVPLQSDTLWKYLLQLAGKDVDEGSKAGRVRGGPDPSPDLLEVGYEKPSPNADKLSAIEIEFEAARITKLRAFVNSRQFARLREILTELYGEDEAKQRLNDTHPKREKNKKVKAGPPTVSNLVSDKMEALAEAVERKLNENVARKEPLSKERRSEWLSLRDRADAAKDLFDNLKSARIVEARAYYEVVDHAGGPPSPVDKIDVVRIGGAGQSVSY